MAPPAPPPALIRLALIAAAAVCLPSAGAKQVYFQGAKYEVETFRAQGDDVAVLWERKPPIVVKWDKPSREWIDSGLDPRAVTSGLPPPAQEEAQAAVSKRPSGRRTKKIYFDRAKYEVPDDKVFKIDGRTTIILDDPELIEVVVVAWDDASRAWRETNMTVAEVRERSSGAEEGKLDLPSFGRVETFTAGYPKAPEFRTVAVFPGYGSDLESLRPLVLEVAKAGYRVHLIDLDSNDDTRAEKLATDPDAAQRVVGEVVEAIGVPLAALVGYSFGANIIAEWAATNPASSVRALALVAPSLREPPRNIDRLPVLLCWAEDDPTSRLAFRWGDGVRVHMVDRGGHAVLPAFPPVIARFFSEKAPPLGFPMGGGAVVAQG